MGSVLLAICLVGVMLTAPFRPHVAVCAYYLMSILAPQSLWPWVFDGIPAFQITAGSVILAFIFAYLNKSIDFSQYKEKQNVLLALLFVLVHLSNWLSPFQSFLAATSVELVMNTFNTIVLMYFVSLPFVATEEGFKAIVRTFLVIIGFYVVWSNWVYFTGDFSQFNQGRLMGPIRGPYRDENKFSVLLVVGAPFFLLAVFHLKSSFQRLASAALLLFTWHAIFLTGSRGALLATIVSTLFAATLIKSKKLGIALILGFTLVVIDQGAQSFSRSSETIATAQEEEDKPIDPRISSWGAGFGFMIEHPWLGVGPQRFQEATKEYYPDKHPYVAHNTFINIAAENGIVAGAIFLYLLRLNWTTFVKRKKLSEIDSFYEFTNSSLIIALVGFYISSIFLDLLIYEVFYFLLLMSFSKEVNLNRKS